MLISEDYRALNRELHESRPDYGTSGQKWAPTVERIMYENACVSALDYGCGKRTLAKALGNPRWLEGYDPAIDGYDELPSQTVDMVICGDVLEHIEPEHIESVLDDLQRLTRKVAFLVIASRPAKKTLADGRNAHLIVKPPHWWLEKIMARFTLIHFADMGVEFIAIARVKVPVSHNGGGPQ